MKYVVQTLALAFSILPTNATASVLLDSTISEFYYVPNLISPPYPFATYGPQTFVVAAGQESTVVIEGVTTFNIDFADTSLTIPFDTILTGPTLNTAAFNGLVFVGEAFHQISGFSISGSSNLAGFDTSRVTLFGNELRLNFSGLSYDTNSVVGLDFVVSAVPEPTTWAMMLLGFLMIGGAMRFNKTKHAFSISRA